MAGPAVAPPGPSVARLADPARPDDVPEVAGAEPAVRTPAAARDATARPAAVSPRARAEIAALLAAKARRTPAQRKLGSRLLDRAAGGGRAERLPRRRAPDAETSVVRAELDALRDREPAALDLPLRREPAPVDTPLDLDRELPPDTPLDPDGVLVDIRAEVAPAVLARIRELDGAVVSSAPRYGAIRAELPLAALEPLAGMDAVRSIRTADEATTLGQAPGLPAAAGADPPGSRAGGREDISEGDAAHRTDAARRAFGVDGTGIGIGVLSDGVESLAARQASGDLPARVTVLPGQAGTGDEGTAMLEIVHDLAPGAELYFATAWEGQARFAENVEALCAAGADVIVDDVIYFREAAFQDDIVARGINAAVADGCFHFSAAGNSGNLNDGTSGTWEGDFVAGGELVVDGVETGGVVHDFGGGVTANTITKDTPYVFVLQWADPWGASANDYDLFLLDAAGENVLLSSTGVQDGTQDPVEMLLSHRRIDTNARLVIVKAPDAAERYLRLGTHGGELAIATAGETYGHLAAENGIGVAAVDVREAAGAGGVFHGTESVDTDSSDGPRRIFFEPDGAPITPGDYSSSGGRVLQKPDLAAASCVSTATPGFSPFCGTSAAAPHAAAVAALLLEAAGGPGAFTLPRLRAAMAEGALDIEAEGVDRDSGAGIVMAGAAVDAVDVPPATRNRPPVVAAVLAGRTLEVGGAVTIDLTGAFADPDDDVLRYTAHSGDPGRLSAHAAGSTLTLTPLAPGGIVTVQVRAADPGGYRVVQSFLVTVGVGDRDYDLDDDGLIEVASLAQLDAVRYDLNGDGAVDDRSLAHWREYYLAFRDGAWDMGCPDECAGYELTANLDFDTNGNGVADAGDAFWNDGAGWAPVGADETHFTAVLEGNGHTLAGLFIHRPAEIWIGLFGQVGAEVEGEVRNVGLVDVRLTGGHGVGGVVGKLWNGRVGGSHATGEVAGAAHVGGLVGWAWHYGVVSASYAAVRVTGDHAAGGLAGVSFGTIRASYATGRVSGGPIPDSDSEPPGCSNLYATRIGGMGGLVGHACGSIVASYATGTVAGEAPAGGLVGTESGLQALDSYWDVETSRVRVGVGADDANGNGRIDAAERFRHGVAGLTTAELQRPVGYEGIYRRSWDLNLDGAPVWDLGAASQYPALSVDRNGDGQASWPSFGVQLRAGPTPRATSPAGQARVDLAWNAADVSAWAPAPDVAYTVFRDDGAVVATVAEAIDALRYTDTAVVAGAAYTYQVAAVVAGGEAARSAPVPVVAGAADPPPLAVGALPDRTLQVGGAALVVDVAGAFSDADDALRYAASSSAPAVATVSVSGSLVTIAPVAGGRAAITVTATDAGGSGTAATRFDVWVLSGYDTDDDGLIEVANLAQLDAVRYDRDGNGVADSPASLRPAYAAAFPLALDGMGCGAGGCAGYELVADLDFDTNGNGVADAGDAYWNDGAGWVAIGGDEVSLVASRPVIAYRPDSVFRAMFEGNGHTVANLFVRGDRNFAGLFGIVGSAGAIRHVGMIDVDVMGHTFVGGLVAYNEGGAVVRSYATGRVATAAVDPDPEESTANYVGGLVDHNRGAVTRSHAHVRVAGDDWTGGLAGKNAGAIVASYAAGVVTGGVVVGGLVGGNTGTVRRSYATGAVSGERHVGGLVGEIEDINTSAEVGASYATGAVSGTSSVGRLLAVSWRPVRASYATGPLSGRFDRGLFGFQASEAESVANYWDATTSGVIPGSTTHRGDGRTTAELQAPTDYSGLYETWNLDLDGDGAADDPWDFGTAGQYPVLTADLDGDGQATWQEFGHQLRAGPTLTATTAAGRGVHLAWTAVDTSAWTPAPDVTYTVTRDAGAGVETIAADLGVLRFTDDDATPGAPTTYQVVAVVNGGQATRSATVTLVAGVANQPPRLVRMLGDRTLLVGAGAAVVDLSEGFEDADGDPLTYSASSSDERVATAGVAGSRLTLSPVAPGRATITVTATDAGGSSVSVTQEFAVEVWTANGTDYDPDDDGLIAITTLDQLDAVRHDLDGDGIPTVDGWAAYVAAFADAADGLGCGGTDRCAGYELAADLDFDTNGSGGADRGDAYWNAGRGWISLGDLWDPFSATLEGNGHVIRHVFSRSSAGLFGYIDGASIRRVGLIDVYVQGNWESGGLVGYQAGGEIHASYVTGVVSGWQGVGGLVGSTHRGVISSSYSTARVSGEEDIGGLAGSSDSTITASHASGAVSGRDAVGGLVGRNRRDISNSYATGRVSGVSRVGGLVGFKDDFRSWRPPRHVASYWDAQTSGRPDGRTTDQLQEPASYSGLYRTWNTDLDGDGVADEPWDFGASTQYPALAVDFDGDGRATWQEFGRQLREGPALTATAAGDGVALTWTAVDAGHWSPAPEVAYNLTRIDDAGAVATLAEEVDGLAFTDTGLSEGAEYTYQVAAVVAGGEATRSALAAVKVQTPPNRGPEAVGALGALTLRVADGAATVDVSGAFLDPDGDPLTYGVVSSAPAVAAVSVAGPVVTLTPLAAGASTVTVTATDPTGSNTPATQTFAVTVPNRSPVAVGTLSAQTVPLADEAVTVEVSGSFSDPDGDPLTYAASSSAPGVATVEMGLGGSAGARGSAGSTLTLTPLAAGETTVTVTATDAGGSGGTATQSFRVTVQNVDYDADDDGLIEIVTLAQLDAVRHDLDGDGVPADAAAGSGTAAAPGASAAGSGVASAGGSREALAPGAAAHAAAFPDAAEGMGCPAAACLGYELAADLDFDTDGSGAAGPGDAFWNGGAGWRPLGALDEPFTAVFSGNGRTVSHLFVAGGDNAGLFGMSSGVIRGVGVVDADVTGNQCAGALAGLNGGRVEASWSTGAVTGDSCVGGLVGVNGLWAPDGGTFRPLAGFVTASWSSADATAEQWVGGLVGYNNGTVVASYAAGPVTATTAGSGAGGLVGRMGFGRNRITASYATGAVSGPGGAVGGLVGHAMPHDRVTASYWDTETSGVTRGGGGAGRTTAALQEPTGYAGLYADWDVDVDVDGVPDAPWDFGTPGAYPALSVDVDGDGAATWRELGPQGRTVTPPAESGAGAASDGAAARALADGATARAQAGGRAAPAAFTDDPLVPGMTPVRAVHLLELRSRIDGLRLRAGLPAFGWTDAQVVPGVTPARAVHLTELRSALGAAYAASGRPAPGYTDAVVTAGATAMRAVQLQELRRAVAALESAP